MFRILSLRLGPRSDALSESKRQSLNNHNRAQASEASDIRDIVGDPKNSESRANKKEVKLKKVKIFESSLKDDEWGAYTSVYSNRKVVAVNRLPRWGKISF